MGNSGILANLTALTALLAIAGLAHGYNFHNLGVRTLSPSVQRLGQSHDFFKKNDQDVEVEVAPSSDEEPEGSIPTDPIKGLRVMRSLGYYIEQPSNDLQDEPVRDEGPVKVPIHEVRQAPEVSYTIREDPIVGLRVMRRSDPGMSLRLMKKTVMEGRDIREDPIMGLRVMKKDQGRTIRNGDGPVGLRIMRRNDPMIGIRVMRSDPSYMKLRTLRGDPTMGIRVMKKSV